MRNTELEQRLLNNIDFWSIKHNIEKIAEMRRYDGKSGITAPAYSQEERDRHHYIQELGRQYGLDVTEDAVGNTIIRLEGENPKSRIMMGSHLDTVYSGGKYDGVLGVVTSLEILKCMKQISAVPKLSVDAEAFVAEESSRFRVSLLGSKMATGEMSADKVENIKDGDGIMLKKAMADLKFDPKNIPFARIDRSFIKAYFELHIEQGPVLLQGGHDVGIVTGIAAPVRYMFELCVEDPISLVKSTNRELLINPFDIRKNSELAASQIILDVERICNQYDQEDNIIRGTVGYYTLNDWTKNVPWDVNFGLDLRSTDEQLRNRVEKLIIDDAYSIEKRFGVKINLRPTERESPVELTSRLPEFIEKICKEEKISHLKMKSGAGHDAMSLARYVDDTDRGVPTTIVFVKHNGRSHCPEENVDMEEVKKAAKIYATGVFRLANEPEIIL